MLNTTAPWPWYDDPVDYPAATYAPTGETSFVDVTEGGEGEGHQIDVVLHDDGTPRYLRAGGRLYAFDPV